MPGICPRCNKNVYFAEERQAVGQSWHKQCFICGHCRKLLDSSNITEHENEMYCSSCYRKRFGPKGYGFGGGAGCLSMDDGEGYSTQLRRSSQNSSHSAGSSDHDIVDSSCEDVRTDVPSPASRSSSSTQQTPSPPPIPPSSSDNIGRIGSQNSVTSKSSITSHDAPAVNNATAVRTSSSKIASQNTARFKWGGVEYCPRCEKAVFVAELMRGAGKAWHKSCFTCFECKKRLDSQLCEREGEIHCKACYGKNFGPKGFGYGIGAGCLKTS